MSITAVREQPAVRRLADVQLDTSMIRLKLTSPEEGEETWPQDKLDLAEQEYRRFLALCLAYPDEAVVPCRLVDEFWHAHILDTRAYREDCERIFGFFYDHYPYFGLNGPQDADNLRTAYDSTLDLYEANFGAPPDGSWIDASVASRAKCRTKCKPVKCK